MGVDGGRIAPSRQAETPVRAEPREMRLLALRGLPEVRQGDDLADLVLGGCRRSGVDLVDGDVVVLAQKIVSKAEGAVIRLADLTVGQAARTLAAQTGKDPRLVEAILRQSSVVLRRRDGVVVVEDRRGFVLANAGLDASNTGAGAGVLLALPDDPDRSAEALRDRLSHQSGAQVAVIINDSWGRPFRLGTVGVALGVAGMRPLADCRGRADRDGRPLQATLVALADELAAAASILMGAGDEGRPVVVVRGAPVTAGDGRGRDLLRDPAIDLFRGAGR